MITSVFYKDRPAIKITAGETEAVFMPGDGGKMISLKSGNKEFLAQCEGEKYRRLGCDSSYVESECSAFDDMFPTIDPCIIGDVCYPDHGEVSRLSWDYEIEEDTLFLGCEAKSVNAYFSKTVYIADEALYITYTIENKNSYKLPYIWAGHMMLAGKEGAYLESGFTADDGITLCFGNPPEKEKIHILGGYGTGKEYKYYYDSPKEPLSYSVVYPSDGCRLEVSFDKTVKYLALWMNPGDLNKMYNLAPEPCTAPYDTPINAEKSGKGSYIDPKSSIEFTMKIKIMKETV